MDIDWAELFTLSVNPVEIFVRGTAVFWFLFALFRFVLRRDVGSIAIADVLLLVLIADASQNAMAGDAMSIADGCLLVVTIGGWNYLLDWASFHSAALRRVLEPRPIVLVQDGRPLRKNLRRELITMDELHAELRKQGLDDLTQIKVARMESDGEISFIPRDGQAPAQPVPSSPPAI